MMCRDTWPLGLRFTLQVCALLVLMLGLVACNSDDFIIPPVPGTEPEMMPAEVEPQVWPEAVVAAMAQSSLGCASVVNADGVRIRTGPGEQYPTLGLGYLDDALPMQGMSQDRNWVEVTAPDGRTAYVFAELTDTVCPDIRESQ